MPKFEQPNKNENSDIQRLHEAFHNKVDEDIAFLAQFKDTDSISVLETHIGSNVDVGFDEKHVVQEDDEDEWRSMTVKELKKQLQEMKDAFKDKNEWKIDKDFSDIKEQMVHSLYALYPKAWIAPGTDSEKKTALWEEFKF